MSAGLTIGATVVGLKETTERVGRAGQSVREYMDRQLARASVALRRIIVAHLSAPASSDPFWGKHSPAGPNLGARSGQSRARISPGGVVVSRGATSYSAVGSPDAHVALHDEGGAVHGSQYLRIPTAAAQTAAGVDRYLGTSIRDIPGAFLLRSRSGTLWAAQSPLATGPTTASARGVRGAASLVQAGARFGAGRTSLTLLYMLVREVSFRGRGFMRASAEEVRPELIQLQAEGIQAVVRAANG